MNADELLIFHLFSVDEGWDRDEPGMRVRHHPHDQHSRHPNVRCPPFP